MNPRQRELVETIIGNMHAWTDAERAEFMQELAESFCPRCGYFSAGTPCTCGDRPDSFLTGREP